MNALQQTFDQLLQKIEELKKTGKIDLSVEEDLSVAVMNLISLEEHFFFTGERTEKSEYFDLMNEIRSLRKDLLKNLIDKHEGETWCISKHLLAASMRLIEVGAKFQADGKKIEAREMFDRAFRAYSMFWALRLKLIDIKEFKKIASEEKPWTLRDIVNKLVDCCDE
ncbi:MAG: hypothetical protein A3I88_00165 [Candidatus Portnoybacteria bacterium RIFCSPLOWO2_12_FULL_39_9]|uniref:Uncharacterized protein n=1 Tax=Candidatus Portnoybacteria bacterium RIFCSPHIGHO2_12_FULL_38_9 TaxID=1801997 RepID=A0A1G2FH44_9BACT|nr:MAG: hypothetical protein A3H00_01830 [Candidatus Portnoybacteria bacterium RBG_13_40_8]OGZ36479.1 MAG: hypothetical protein A2646_01420 [Candidatus Portnoybacteria bacterium RIFCSPHIGHO2_02_FULL_39_12]OGZ37404.1 MAG: hypothetical protein A3J64_01685 [Candidatus Portnoybacteria bacterium RIFCSPHIGHO2_12_FULL_38_9]OGZ39278.1 MAG: hypothetical protein A3F21_01690 [Candidatus Portnoybacteria bacterium RIFCSPLOWO2_01_FULL_38_39]OGZ41140.1 MAG: hypothetical protein A3I88_00165 [Candidatus Portnoy